MLLKDTPVGDIEVNSDDEADARAFVNSLVARHQIATEEQEVGKNITHKVVLEDGKRVLKRVRFY